jgi:hypothetical protein
MRSPRPLWLVFLSLAACAQGRGGDGDDGFGADAAWLPDAAGRPDASSGRPDAAGTALVINEFVANHIGTDTSEFIELFGSPGTDYSDHVVLAVEGEGTGIGAIDRIFPVGATDAGGRFVTEFMTNLIENDTVTLLLVRGFDGALGVDLDTNDDGVLDSQPWAELVDAVAVRSAAAGVTYAGAAVLAPGHDAVNVTVGGASRMPDGADSDSASDWVRNDFDGAGLPCCAAAAATTGEAMNTPGASNAVAP